MALQLERAAPRGIVVERKVDVVVLNSRKKDEHLHWDWDHVLYQKYLAHGFERVAVVKARRRYFLFVLARPGTLAHRGLHLPDRTAPGEDP